MGFGPQLVDFDGDGRQDVISGDWLGQVIVFRRKLDGSFAAGEPLKDREGKPLRIGYGLSAFACDWDADGDLDLLAGTVDRDKANVYLLSNTGSRTSPAFDKPEPLDVDGKAIVAADGDAAPVAADWDGDGRLDLLLGTGQGSVLLYRNIGTPQQPRLTAPQTLVPPPEPGDPRGTRAKICVTDWNEDGRPDLLLGDFGGEFDKTLSPEEEKWREEARRHQADLLTTWSKVFREYRQILAAPPPAEEAKAQQRQKQLAELRGELQRLNSARESYHRQAQALQPGKQYHGRVWLFCRKASSP
jgi:hypothetical protein